MPLGPRKGLPLASTPEYRLGIIKAKPAAQDDDAFRIDQDRSADAGATARARHGKIRERWPTQRIPRVSALRT